VLLEIARIAKPHGLKGHVNIVALSNRGERFQVGQTFTTESRLPNRLVELTILEVKPSATKFDYYVLFEGITTPEQALSLKGVVLLAEPLDDKVLDEKEYWVHDLKECTVYDLVSLDSYDDAKELGVVQDVLANPASDLLDLGNNLLIPITFVKELDKVKKRIYVDIPDGLLSINED
jgi:16S rRNA processing protein RimM